MTTPHSAYRHIPLAHLAPSPTNPRKHFDDDALRELADTIADHGVIEPIIVRTWPDDYDTPAGRDARPQYEIIAGERRYRASILAGQDTIPALIRHLDTRQVLEVQIIENLQRRGVNELEEAEGYQIMMQEYGYTADELAAKVGASRAYIYGRLKLTALCDQARQAYRAGKLDASRALLIARIPGATLQTKALKEITEGYQGEMSYRNAARYIQNQYMRGLRNVIFGLDDATLLPEAGPCTTCAKRPCNTPELYPDVPEDRAADACTDPECMTAKTAAHLQHQAEAAAAAGRHVVRGVSWGEFGRDYMELDHEDDALPEATEIVMVEHPSTHQLVACVRVADYRQAVPAPEDTTATSRDTYTQRAAACNAEAARRRDIFAAIRARYDRLACCWASPVTPELRIIAQQLWAKSNASTRSAVAKLHNITPEQHDCIDSWLTSATPADLITLALDLSLEPTTDVPAYRTDLTTPAPLLQLAHAYGIDPDTPAQPAPKTLHTLEQAPPGGEETAPHFAIGDRVQVPPGAVFDGGCPITPYNTLGTIQAAISDGYEVLFEDGSRRTYIPATALEPVPGTVAARASPAGEDEVSAYRCRNTPDIFEGVTP